MLKSAIGNLFCSLIGMSRVRFYFFMRIPFDKQSKMHVFTFNKIRLSIALSRTIRCIQQEDQ
jgi:hypothetical protein